MARALVTAALVAALLAVFVRTFLVQAFAIPTDSMAPGLLAGDHILVNKFIYGYPSPPPALAVLLPMRGARRGDVVVFRSPRDPRQRVVKRCLGLPGETLAGDGRRLRIDGSPLDESGYLHPAADPARPPPVGSFGPAEIPTGRCFLLGDHRSRALDSRSWGAIPVRSFTGRAVMVYWSVRPGGDVADNPGPWDKMTSRSPAGWLQRWRWRRIFKLIR